MEVNCGLGYTIHITTEIQFGFLEQDFVVTDRNVFQLYRDRFSMVKDGHLVVLKPGERTKRLRSVKKICRAMQKANCDRHTRLVAVGGGVVGDVAGFAAAVYLRGVDYVQVPTTLLSMVDSSVGGKTAVNLHGKKNAMGAFKQPKAVYICTNFLATLPGRELASGDGEILKTAFLDADLLDYICANKTAFFAKERSVVTEVIARCIAFKARIVEQDETEKGLRKILNLGHTVGHALEAAEKFRLSHGAYVLNGLIYEARIAKHLGLIEDAYFRQIVQLCEIALCNKLAPLPASLTDYALTDKKNADGKIVCVLPVEKGVTTERAFTADEFRQLMEAVV